MTRSARTPPAGRRDPTARWTPTAPRARWGSDDGSVRSDGSDGSCVVMAGSLHWVRWRRRRDPRMTRRPCEVNDPRLFALASTWATALTQRQAPHEEPPIPPSTFSGEASTALPTTRSGMPYAASRSAVPSVSSRRAARLVAQRGCHGRPSSAHVHIQRLERHAGIAARYVSGHLVGEGGSHAWVGTGPGPGPPRRLGLGGMGPDPLIGRRATGT